MFRSSRLLRQHHNQQVILDNLQGLERRLSQSLQIHNNKNSIQCSSFSSSAAVETKKADDNNDNNTKKKQPFVTASLEPGEWDINRTDPYFRPKPPRSRMISAEDYANRPPVGFENDFSTYEDSMVSLSWLDAKKCRQIYQMYIDMMVLSQREHKTTSHEYVCRVIAQKFNITPMRAAAVVQLQHSEEQLRQHHPELLCEEQAKYAEQAIQQNIRDAYRSERSQQPKDFVEDPVGTHGRGGPDETSKSWVKTDDIYDLEERVVKANVRDEENARLIIDGHVYKEDVDEKQVTVKTDRICKRLIKAQKEQQHNNVNKKPSEDDDDGNDEPIPYPETNAKGIKRPRWKFAAKVVNTRDMRKRGRKVINYTNNNVENTLIEHDGKLRVATVDEAKQVAWKPSRSKDNEYIYQGAKTAWLQKTLEGKTNVWGRVPTTRAAVATAAAAAGGGGGSSSSSSSSVAEAKLKNEKETKEVDDGASSSSDSDSDSDSNSDSDSGSSSESDNEEEKKSNEESSNEKKKKD